MLKDVPEETVARLMPIDLEIIKARCAIDFSIEELTLTDRENIADEIMISCSATFGCQLPASKEISDSVSKGIRKLFEREGYKDLSEEEIHLAMSFNFDQNVAFPDALEIQQVKNSGQFVNVEFVSKIVYNYMLIRKFLDRKLQNFIDGF